MRRANGCGAHGRDAEALAQWWGPKGATMRVINLDFRPGGTFHYAMAFQPGHEMYGRFIYREIVAPERLVFVISFSDAEGGITRAPFPQLKDMWPLEVLNVVTFTEHAGKTTIALRGGPDQRHRGRARDVRRQYRLDASGLWRHLREARRPSGEILSTRSP